jgi:UDP-N-acetylmuramate dehydrogenase
MSNAFRVIENAALNRRNTFGIAALAPWLVEIADTAALPEVLALPRLQDAPALILGGGSNLLFAGNPEGAVVSFDCRRMTVLREDDDHAVVRAEAGAEWHALVLWTLQQGLSGLENLALIPGTAGAAPIQNIGAYGCEVGEYVHAVEAFDRTIGELRRLDRAACAFAYRDSLFKREPDRYVVTALELSLPRVPALRLDYAGIREELSEMGVALPNARKVAQAVIRIRQRKLPDPAVIGNAGSFFKNPIVPAVLANDLQLQHVGLPMFRGDAADNRKLSAAWMIEACGWKGFREGDAGVSAQHALVLVNHGGATGAQLLSLARRIADSVQARFGIAIEPEPKVIGARW